MDSTTPLTTEQVNKAIWTKFCKDAHSDYEGYEEFATLLESRGKTTLPGIGEIIRLEANYGGFGYDGKSIYFVFSAGEQFFKVQGTYSSWDGREWYTRVVQVEQVKVVTYKYADKK